MRRMPRIMSLRSTMGIAALSAVAAGITTTQSALASAVDGVGVAQIIGRIDAFCMGGFFGLF